MNYLIDTNVVSEVMRPEPNEFVLAWLASTPESQVKLSVVTLGELERGILRLGDTRRARQLRACLDEVRQSSFEVLSVDAETMRAWASLVVGAETKGRPAPMMDTLLAATCARHGLTLVTRHVSDFEAFELPLIDPWSS